MPSKSKISKWKRKRIVKLRQEAKLSFAEIGYAVNMRPETASKIYKEETGVVVK